MKGREKERIVEWKQFFQRAKGNKVLKKRIPRRVSEREVSNVLK